ncbi:hypothetical protein [Leptolyngbya sp. FACHB-261]|uniref:hypothetical protein n=1 Tax=Leptolyngbya sp. FACHB-261 TaxID=2692806 RepID=UPI001681F964|nr:hypothetical protein [Leptolyngbya sp. FACHB-261]MBD2099879.1 hypothetical protein [Leptolyngbya sp. FACHB-261]
MFSSLYVLVVLPFVFAFVLGFSLYTVGKNSSPTETAAETPPQVSAQLLKQLREEGYLESNGKLRTEALAKALDGSLAPASNT